MSRHEQKPPGDTLANPHASLDSQILNDTLAGLPDALEAALNSDMRDRVIHYLETLIVRVAPERSPFHVSRERLASTHAFTDEELGQFSDADFADMSERLETHYREDWYPEEIVFHAQAILEEKAKITTK